MTLLVFVVVLVVGGLAAVGIVASRPRTAPTRLHVDELARGDVPRVCVIRGVPADSMVEVEGASAGFHPLWLVLLLLGPVGIVVIVVLATTGSRARRFGGLLPMSDDVLDRYNRRVRTARAALVVAVGGVGLAVAALVLDSLYAAPLAVLAAVAITGGMLAVLVASASAAAGWPRLRLEGSNRWVVVEHAHPRFSAAVDERRRRSRDDRIARDVDSGG